MFALFEDLSTVHENVNHAGRVLVRLFIRRMIGNRIRIENDYVGVISFFKLSPPIELKILRRQPSQTPDRLGQCYNLFLADIFAEQPSEVPISGPVAKVRLFYSDNMKRMFLSFLKAKIGITQTK